MRKLLQRGERYLAKPDAPEPTVRALWFVRVYYQSLGGDVLHFISGPFSLARAEQLMSEYGYGRRTDALGKPTWHRRRGGPDLSTAVAAQCFKHDEFPKPLDDTRAIVLPSQWEQLRNG